MKTTGNYEAVNKHYGKSGLGAKILEALRGAGADVDALTPNDLAPLDHLHTGDREATLKLAELTRLEDGERVLDIGCGIGGPARTLAVEFGCLVTGVDITEEYCLAAQMLTERMGLSSKVDFRHASALELPFVAGFFDVVWTQQMIGHVQDKKQLFGEIHRVLRTGGRLTVSEPCLGAGEAPSHLTGGDEASAVYFVASAEDYRKSISARGFRELIWNDVTAECIRWARAALAVPQDNKFPLSRDLVEAYVTRDRREATLRNMETGRMVMIRAVFERVK